MLLKFMKFLVPLSLLVVASCAPTRGGPIPYGVTDFGVPDSALAPLLEEEHRIGPLDKIKITVFQVPDLSGEYEVDLRGMISFPLLGEINAAGLTAVELDLRVTEGLRGRFVKSPDVLVGVLASGHRVITVDGSVREPGFFPAGANLTLLRVVALAKGLDEDANPRRIVVFRQTGGKRMAAAFDLVSIRRGESEDPQLFSGDIVVVEGSRLKASTRSFLQSVPLIALFRPF